MYTEILKYINLFKRVLTQKTWGNLVPGPYFTHNAQNNVYYSHCFSWEKHTKLIYHIICHVYIITSNHQSPFISRIEIDRNFLKIPPVGPWGF